jgi:hypothetical protein
MYDSVSQKHAAFIFNIYNGATTQNTAICMSAILAPAVDERIKVPKGQSPWH